MPNEILNTFPNKWFSVNKNHSLADMNERPLSNLFFDTTADFNTSNRSVNLIITTPEDSEHSYKLDISSGQRYFSHSYCKQKDIWNVYPKSIDRPIFSIGYMPRTLDQTGEPQKVIVWSKTKNHQQLVATNYVRVRLLGAFIEQLCLEGNCLGKDNWVSRLVFVAIDEDDQKSSGIDTLESFKEAFDWEKSKAYLANIDGRNFIGDKTYPAVKVSELISYDDAIKHFKKHSIVFSDDELSKVQKNCHLLYDKLWEQVGRVREEDLPAKNGDEATGKILLKEKFQKEKKPFGFAARFSAFTKKYFQEITTCEKFVYHGNVNRDRDKFWFLSYVGMFYRMNREGFYFDCKSRVWHRNQIDEKGDKVYDIKSEISGCKEKDIDQAMGYLPNYLNGLKGEKEFYRFVDYDNHSFGSHSKLYSWVKMKAQKFECSNDPNDNIRRGLKISPEDVTWQERHVKDFDEELKIIR